MNEWTDVGYYEFFLRHIRTALEDAYTSFPRGLIKDSEELEHKINNAIFELDEVIVELDKMK